MMENIFRPQQFMVKIKSLIYREYSDYIQNESPIRYVLSLLLLVFERLYTLY